jgi:hypothetical protein
MSEFGCEPLDIEGIGFALPRSDLQDSDLDIGRSSALRKLGRRDSRDSEEIWHLPDMCARLREPNFRSLQGRR